MRPPPTEKSYHIFYQMLAGLTPAERSQLGLEGLTVRDLLYLNAGDTRQDEVADAQRFADWKSSLSVLGIPFMDVVRVLVIYHFQIHLYHFSQRTYLEKIRVFLNDRLKMTDRHFDDDQPPFNT